MTEPQDIITTRGLVDTDFGTPLRDFNGILDGYALDEAAKYGTRVNLNYRDIEVVQAAEPYLFPTAVISIKLSNRKKSAWGFFGDSLNKIIPEEEDLKDQVGKRMGLRLTPDVKFGKNRDTGEDIIAPCWGVYSVEGVESEVKTAGKKPGGKPTVGAKDEAIRLLDNKTIPEFNNVIYQNPIVQKDPDLLRSITDRTFVAALKAAGLFTEDENGVMHKSA